MDQLKESRLSLICFIFLLTALFTGCAHLFPPPSEQPLARQMADLLNARGDAISQFKCLARVRMESSGRILSGRVAIAAVAPDKLRVEWLSMMGQPFFSFLADGETITVVSRSDGKVHRLKQSPWAMESLVHIPIGVEDLQRILVGSIPLRDHAYAQLNETAGAANLLTLMNRWHGVIANIQVDPTDFRVQSMRLFGSEGELRYSVQWLRWQYDERYDLPVEVAFQSDSGQRLVLTMVRFWPNVDVPSSTFSFGTPES